METLIILLKLLWPIMLIIVLLPFLIKIQNKARKNLSESLEVLRQRYEAMKIKYGTEFCGVFKLYDGLPMAEGTECEVAYSGDEVIISAGHFEQHIPVSDISNIYRNVIQEGYTKTSVYGLSGAALTLGAVSAVGNAVKKSAAQKNVLIINSLQGEIIFFSTDEIGMRHASVKEIKRIKAQTISLPDNYIYSAADSIVAAFEADSYKRKS